jgi:hypothetical protein
MEKVIHKLINEFTEGVDTYTHNGSTWLIFTDTKQWVIELTEEKTLWYNYNFFKGMFAYTSMDVVENQHYITKWVEDNIINKVKDTILERNITEGEVEGIIQDGVKTTYAYPDTSKVGINDTIQNGVKLTQFNDNENKSWVVGVIKNGVRHTLNTEYMPTSMVEDIIQSGVKHTEYGDWLDGDERLDDIVKNGVKRSLPESFVDSSTIIDIIQNGVKETKTPGKDGDIMSTIEWLEENNSTSYPKMIDDIIENGVKETKPIPGESPIYPNGIIDDVIESGEKINGTYDGGQRQSIKCKSVVEYGTKNPSV